MSLSLAPSTGSAGASQVFSERQVGTYAYDDKRPFAGSHSDVVVSLAPMTSVKLLVARADTPIDIKITHAGGTDQVVPVDGELTLHCPNRPITGIKLNGNATGVLILAGD